MQFEQFWGLLISVQKEFMWTTVKSYCWWSWNQSKAQCASALMSVSFFCSDVQGLQWRKSGAEGGKLPSFLCQWWRCSLHSSSSLPAGEDPVGDLCSRPAVWTRVENQSPSPDSSKRQQQPTAGDPTAHAAHGGGRSLLALYAFFTFQATEMRLQLQKTSRNYSVLLSQLSVDVTLQLFKINVSFQLCFHDGGIPFFCQWRMSDI